jgi:hypothetical protein
VTTGPDKASTGPRGRRRASKDGCIRCGARNGVAGVDHHGRTQGELQAEPLMPVEIGALTPTFMVVLYGLRCFLASITADILWWSVRDRAVEDSSF